MCNLYSHRKGPAAIIDLFRAMQSDVGNLEPADYYPDYPAPIVRHDEAGGLILTKARWGLTSSRKVILDNASRRADKLRAKGKTVDADAFAEILRMEPDGGTTNVRNTASSHWKPLLGPGSLGGLDSLGMFPGHLVAVPLLAPARAPGLIVDRPRRHLPFDGQLPRRRAAAIGLDDLRPGLFAEVIVTRDDGRAIGHGG